MENYIILILIIIIIFILLSIIINNIYNIKNNKKCNNDTIIGINYEPNDTIIGINYEPNDTNIGINYEPIDTYYQEVQYNPEIINIEEDVDDIPIAEETQDIIYTSEKNIQPKISTVSKIINQDPIDNINSVISSNDTNLQKKIPVSTMATLQKPNQEKILVPYLNYSLNTIEWESL